MIRSAITMTLLIGLVPLMPTARGDENLDFFEQKVRPLLVEHCYECHSERAEKLKGGLRLDSRQSILHGGDNGPAAIEGQPAASLLVQAVRYEEAGFEMPPDGKLSPREIAVLEEWVARGLVFPESRNVPIENKAIDIEAGKKHWSFLPWQSRQPDLLSHLPFGENHRAPSEFESRIGQRRIDAYLRDDQIEAGVTWAPPASPAVLYRRAKLALVGLPPTPEELKAFLADPSPAAYEEAIDRWLASPRYGEKWGRYWLELARYCDVLESWAETQGNAYFYRDWVIQSFNEDLPYDRFVKLQLAADQMEDAQPSDMAALGLLGLSPSYWKELQLPVEIIKTIVSDEYEERVHTLSSTFLGLNIACARCHDHKYDPITTHDYYGLAGVLASTRIADRAVTPGIDGLKIFEGRRTLKMHEATIKKLEGVNKKLSTKKKEAPKETPKEEEDASEPEQATIAKNQKEIDQLRLEIETIKKIPGFDTPLAPGVVDATLEVKEAIGTHGSRIVYHTEPKDAAIEIRGNPNKTGETVPRRFISVLSQGEPRRFSQGSGRRELADALFDECESLLARVIVNRIWKLHFGRGLVDTPSDFGTLGEPPTHPELLDDIARRFVEKGWSIKWLHREIMLSSTYQQSSHGQSTEDTENRLYTRAPIRRLDVEAWRDAMLQVTSSLDLEVGGKPSDLHSPENHRRTVYGTVKRRELADILRLYDFPDPITHSPQRSLTTTPLQQLFALNSPFLLQRAEALVERLHREAPDNDRHRIEQAYQLLYGRSPDSKEMELGLAFLDGDRPDRWKHYAQVLLGNNEFFFVD